MGVCEGLGEGPRPSGWGRGAQTRGLRWARWHINDVGHSPTHAVGGCHAPAGVLLGRVPQ